MSKKILKEMLKPPYKRDGAKIKLTDLMWLELHNKDNILNVSLLDFTATAINEKYERDFRKPLRWEYVKPGKRFVRCPKCPDFIFENHGYNCCPNCGRKLDPPEETK